ncbi:MAG: nucleotidyltransferase domain-containing protein [Saprospiraceae bacterium]|nr:nucleotidyltransferase domain-containing protein [Saprospiraceae bacterium]
MKNNPITEHINEINDSCARFRVSTLYAFGSVLTTKFKENSDIDLLVEFDETDPFVYGELYFGFKFELEQLLRLKIDLLESKSLKNQRFRQAIKPNMQLIYAGRNSAMA